MSKYQDFFNTVKSKYPPRKKGEGYSFRDSSDLSQYQKQIDFFETIFNLAEEQLGVEIPLIYGYFTDSDTASPLPSVKYPSEKFYTFSGTYLSLIDRHIGIDLKLLNTYGRTGEISTRIVCDTWGAHREECNIECIREYYQVDATNTFRTEGAACYYDASKVKLDHSCESCWLTQATEPENEEVLRKLVKIFCGTTSGDRFASIQDVLSKEAEDDWRQKHFYKNHLRYSIRLI